MDVACRVCEKETELVIDLGYHPPSDGFLTKEQLNEPETYYPLSLRWCPNCHLGQLGYFVSPEKLFNNEYPYQTGSNIGGVAHFACMAHDIVGRYQLQNKDLVIDIGSNDGTMLGAFRAMGCRILGVEPSLSVAEIAVKNGIPTVCAFFGEKFDLLNEKAKVITATNVFAHVPDIHGFVYAVKKNLSEDGVFIVENPYFLETINGVQYDQIYHEHYYYWSLKPMAVLMGMYGLEVFDAERQDIHGGTIRYHIGHTGKHGYVKHRMRELIKIESEFSCNGFDEGVKKRRERFEGAIRGKDVVGIGAPAKGNTLLNYSKITPRTIRLLAEKNPLKIGRFSPGGHIPIVDEKEIDAELGVILSWNWAKEIKKSFKGKVGGFFIP